MMEALEPETKKMGLDHHRFNLPSQVSGAGMGAILRHNVNFVKNDGVKPRDGMRNSYLLWQTRNTILSPLTLFHKSMSSQHYNA